MAHRKSTQHMQQVLSARPDLQRNNNNVVLAINLDMSKHYFRSAALALYSFLILSTKDSKDRSMILMITASLVVFQTLSLSKLPAA